MRTLLALALLVLFSAPVWAQEAAADPEGDVLTRLMTVVSHKGIQGKVAQILQHDEKRLTPACQELGSARPVEITVLEVPAFNEAKAPVGGRWTVRYEVDVCGRKLLRAIDFKADGTSINMGSLLPGNTKGDPQLQADVTKAFKMAVLKAHPECKVPFVADTRLLSVPRNGDAPWEELWVMNACGNIFGQAIRFAPQEDGTAFALDIPTK